MSPSPIRASKSGKIESAVRFIEESGIPTDKEVGSALGRHGFDRLLAAMAISAARSICAERTPTLAPWAIQAVRQLVEEAQLAPKGPELRELTLRLVRMIRGEIQARGPYRLPDFDDPPAGTKEEATFSFLDAVRSGDIDGADQRFQWIARDLTREQATDLLLSAGLPKFTSSADTLIAPVESLAQLSWVGWEHAPLLLRPVVRMQAAAVASPEIYDQACHVVSARQLLRTAGRRAPGAIALGERDPAAFFQLATEWAEADGAGRLAVVASALATDHSVEDVADAIATGGTLLFLQEGLRGGARRWTPQEAAAGASIVRASHSLRRMVKIATPGQRILGVLLAGYAEPLRLRLRPGSPDCGWWLSPAAKLLEPAQGEVKEAPAQWRDALRERSSNGLLPALTAEMPGGTAGLSAELMRSVVARDLSPLELIVDRTLHEGYVATRSPHRWLHLWAAALSHCAWPAGSEEVLSGDFSSASVPPGSGPVSV